MHLVAFFSFLFAAAIGLTMAVRHFRGQDSGKALGLAHGLFALSGIALLAVGLWQLDAGVGWWMVASFGVVAAGGAYLFSRQVQDEPWPGFVIVAHGGLAIATIVVLGLWLADPPEEPSENEVPGAQVETQVP